MRAFIIVLGLLVAACSTGNQPSQGHPTGSQPGQRHPDAHTTVRAQAGSPTGLTTVLTLPSRTMVAGSSLKGQIIVENDTGHAIHTGGCGSLFQVDLVSSMYHPTVAWTNCLQSLTIPVGRSRYPVTVEASYNQCAENPPSYAAPACLPAGPPPLPSGNYEAVLFQSSHVVPTPPGIAMRVTPPKRHR